MKKLFIIVMALMVIGGTAYADSTMESTNFEVNVMPVLDLQMDDVINDIIVIDGVTPSVVPTQVSFDINVGQSGTLTLKCGEYSNPGYPGSDQLQEYFQYSQGLSVRYISGSDPNLGPPSPVWLGPNDQFDTEALVVANGTLIGTVTVPVGGYTGDATLEISLEPTQFLSYGTFYGPGNYLATFNLAAII